jgi:hypothetical protein
MSKHARKPETGSIPPPRSDHAPPLTFGIYPGGGTGPEGSGMAYGPPDKPVRIFEALRELEKGARPLIVRGYRPFEDPGSAPGIRATPESIGRYAVDGRRLDLVLMFRSVSGDVEAFERFVREQVRTFGAMADTIQVTEEPNCAEGAPPMDGVFPNVREALVRGVTAAKLEARRLGHDHLKVGFNAVPSFGDDGFWSTLGGLGGSSFVRALDYVGIDFFPDVFRPVAPDGEPGDLRESVVFVLEAMRGVWLPAAGIPPTVPIHVAENGWGTGPTRPPERQAERLETIIRTVHDYRGNFHVTRYQLFDLRDADSHSEDALQFGIMDDRYTPKPAFDVFRRLIAELGAG